MTAGIVDRLEIVEVHVQQRVLFAVGTHRFDQAGQPALELAAIHQAGQCIVAGLPTQLLRHFLDLADVMEHDDPADQVAFAVVYRRRRIAHRAHIAGTPQQPDRHALRAPRADRIAARVRNRLARLFVDHAVDNIQRLAFRVAVFPAGIFFRHRVHVVDVALRVERDDTVADGMQGDFGQFLLAVQFVLALRDAARHNRRYPRAGDQHQYADQRDQPQSLAHRGTRLRNRAQSGGAF